MSDHGHGHGHESHGGHGSHGAEKGGFKDLLFPTSLMGVYTKNGLRDWLEGFTDTLWQSGLGAPSDTPDSISELFGAGGGGGGGHGHGGGHGGGHGHH